jgi:hypothetical protein
VGEETKFFIALKHDVEVMPVKESEFSNFLCSDTPVVDVLVNATRYQSLLGNYTNSN